MKNCYQVFLKPSIRYLATVNVWMLVFLTNGHGFLTPFRSTRYHLKEWVSSQQQPKTPKELHNLRHSRAKNIVERTFGLWKKKWVVLRTQSFFEIHDQVTCVYIGICC